MTSMPGIEPNGMFGSGPTTIALSETSPRGQQKILDAHGMPGLFRIKIQDVPCAVTAIKLLIFQ
jgi:hypothetical protein